MRLVGQLLRDVALFPVDLWAVRAVTWLQVRSWLRGKRFDLGTWQEVERG